MKKAFLNPVYLLILPILVLTNCVSDGDFPRMEKPADAVPISSSFSSSSDASSSSSDVSSSSSDMSSSSSEEISSSSIAVYCGSIEYDSSNDNLLCEDEVLKTKCGTSWYNSETQFCQEETNAVKDFCGNETYTASQFCYNNSKVGNFCGARTVTYNPELYECRSTNSNGIYLKEDINYEGQKYKAVLIGEQTWMAENLNYKVDGSKCTTDSRELSDSNTEFCDKYGRLYNWATAMNNFSSSNTIPSGVKGICPDEWHLPSDAEWHILFTYVQTDNNGDAIANYEASIAGKYLKAVEGWAQGHGEDKYGFAAIPGGIGYDTDYGTEVGRVSYWWSSTEYNNDFAHMSYMEGYYEQSTLFAYDKGYLFSIRCVMN